MVLMSIRREKCYHRFGRLHCKFSFFDVVEQIQQIDVEAIEYVSHHWSGCVDGNVIGVLV